MNLTMDSTSSDSDMSVKFSQLEVKFSLLEREVATLKRDKVKDKRAQEALEDRLFVTEAVVDSLKRKLRSGHGQASRSRVRLKQRHRDYYPDNQPSSSTASERAVQNQVLARTAGTAQPTNRNPNSLRNRRERSPLTNSSDPSGIHIDMNSTRANINAPVVVPALEERPAKRHCSVSRQNRPNVIQGAANPGPSNAVRQSSRAGPSNAIQGGPNTGSSNAVQGGSNAGPSNNHEDQGIIQNVHRIMNASFVGTNPESIPELAEICSEALKGLEEWNTRKLNEDEKQRLLKAMTSPVMIHKLKMDKCTTSRKGVSIWPEIVRKAWPEHSKNNAKIQDIVKFLAGAAAAKAFNAKFKVILEAIITGHERHCTHCK